jgi:hypothetical protein
MKNLSLLIIAMILLMGGCKKDQTTSVPALLTKNWKMTSRLYSNFEQLRDCDKDDFWNFSADKNLFVNVGTEYCNFIGETSEWNGSFTISDDQKALLLKTINQSSIIFEINTLTESSLVLKINQVGSFGAIQIFTFVPY